MDFVHFGFQVIATDPGRGVSHHVWMYPSGVLMIGKGPLSFDFDDRYAKYDESDT